MKFMDLIKEELIEVEREIYEIIPDKPKEVYGMLPGFIKRGGKRIRPALTLLSNIVVGGDTKKVIRTAALIEIFHNFTLIHDDIEDDSQIRRGEPTLNKEYGIPIALNAGDALYTLLWMESAKNKLGTTEKNIEIQKRLAESFLRVVEGQGVELSWYREKKVEVTEEEYHEMVGGKTGALVALSCDVGAYLGGASKKTCETLKNFGYKIGIAFQIQDDVLNVTGEFEKYKKEIGGDIREGKRTLMVAKSFENATENEKTELQRVLTSNLASEREIAHVISIFNKYGAVNYAKNKANEIINDAKADLEQLPENDAKEALKELADFVIKREV